MGLGGWGGGFGVSGGRARGCAFRRGGRVDVSAFNLALGLPLVAATAYVKATVALADAPAAWVCFSAGRASSRLCR